MVACHRSWLTRDIPLSFMGPANASWLGAHGISRKFYPQQCPGNVDSSALEAAYGLADRTDFLRIPAHFVVRMALRRRLLAAHSRLRGRCRIPADRFFFVPLATL